MDNMRKEAVGQLGTIMLHNYCGAAPVTVYAEGPDANWKSQKTSRKNRRRLSNAPKAVRRRMGFRGRRG